MRGVAPAQRPAAVFAAALLGAGVIGLLVLMSPQAAAAASFLMSIVALYLRSRRWGLIALWTFWLVSPGIRRMLGLSGGYQNADPLALAPFVATAALAGIELWREPIKGQMRTIALLVGGGFLIGIPTGLASPQAAVFALLAYGTGLSCMLLAYREGATSVTQSTLIQTLMLVGPILAIYGIAQYFLPLTTWDDVWLKTVDLESIGSPESGRVRVFSLLNSPGTMGAMMGMTVLCYLGARRLSVPIVIGAGLCLTALGLTYVRASWVSLVAGAAVLVVTGRGRVSLRILIPVAVMIVALPSLAASNPTAERVLGRFETLGNTGNDKSANDRLALFDYIPEGVSYPLGHGLGAAGEASRLGGAQNLRAPDNGFLSVLWQVGPLGFVLVMAGLGLGVAAAVRVAQTQGLILALLAFWLATLATGDALYGVGGVSIWFLVGLAYALQQDQPATKRSVDLHSPLAQPSNQPLANPSPS